MKFILITLILSTSAAFSPGYTQPAEPGNHYLNPVNTESSQEMVSSQQQTDSPSCEEIKYRYDKLTGISTYSSPVSEIGKLSAANPNTAALNISKEINGADTIIQIGILGTTENYESETKGAVLVLDNGYKIDVPDLDFILIQTSSVAYFYFGTILLTEGIKELLKNNKITDLRLFAYTPAAANDYLIPENEALQLQYYLNCLLNGVE